jgi:alpha/beta superfamily hydrolase
VLCHPHPQYGGTMRSIVTSALFEALPASGFDCLRFNFRGVEGSEGEYSSGVAEPLDVVAALDAAAQAAPGLPIALVGWSFGADMALVVADERVTAWVAIAPPLRFRPSTDYSTVAHDARPKLLLLAAHDEYRAPDDVAARGRDVERNPRRGDRGREPLLRGPHRSGRRPYGRCPACPQPVVRPLMARPRGRA